MNMEKALRLLVTIAALLAAFVHIKYPELNIDAVTLGLLVVAIIPWLSPIIKSIELPGIGKIELQEIKHQAEEARGAALSASQKADLALAGTSVIEVAQAKDADVSSTPEEAMLKLAAAYNNIRDTQKSGPSRTSAMTSIVRQMIDLTPRLQNCDVEAGLKDSDRGKRLGAYAYLYARPDFSKLDKLVLSVTQIEDKPFGQYWGLQSIGKVIGSRNGQKISTKIVQQLREFLAKLQPGTDRYYELSRILKELSKNDEEG